MSCVQVGVDDALVMDTKEEIFEMNNVSGAAPLPGMPPGGRAASAAVLRCVPSANAAVPLRARLAHSLRPRPARAACLQGCICCTGEGRVRMTACCTAAGRRHLQFEI